MKNTNTSLTTNIKINTHHFNDKYTQKMMNKMLLDPQFRRSPKCSRFSLLINEKDKNILNYKIPEISGNKITEEFFLQNGFNFPLLIQEEKESIELITPRNIRTLSDIANIIGRDFQVKVPHLFRLIACFVLFSIHFLVC